MATSSHRCGGRRLPASSMLLLLLLAAAAGTLLLAPTAHAQMASIQVNMHVIEKYMWVQFF